MPESDRFGARAHRYVTSPTHAAGQDLERLCTLAAPQPDWLALDVATGGGHTARILAPWVAWMLATDVSPVMLEAARAAWPEDLLGRAAFAVMDAHGLACRDGTFHLVTCRIAAHHFEDPATFVHEAARVLRPGGRLVVQDIVALEDPDLAEQVNRFERLRDPSHRQALSAGTWRTLFQAAGFEVTHAEVVVKRHHFLTWARRQDCTVDAVQSLVALVDQGPPALHAWLEPRRWGTDQATFVNRHLLMVGMVAPDPDPITARGV